MDQEGRRKVLDFIRYLLMNDGAVAWHEVEHPTYGIIEIGGMKKEVGRVPPSFMLEEECHRNAMFTLYHAEMTPRVSFGNVVSERLGRRLFKVWVEVVNDGLMPTRCAQDVENHISPPDIISLSSKKVEVISSGRVVDRFFKRVVPTEIRHHLVEFDAVPGMDSVRAQFIVSGTGEVTITFDSAKGGLLKKELDLSRL
jgi:hypothetical protein